MQTTVSEHLAHIALDIAICCFCSRKECCPLAVINLVDLQQISKNPLCVCQLPKQRWIHVPGINSHIWVQYKNSTHSYNHNRVLLLPIVHLLVSLNHLCSGINTVMQVHAELANLAILFSQKDSSVVLRLVHLLKEYIQCTLVMSSILIKIINTLQVPHLHFHIILPIIDLPIINLSMVGYIAMPLIRWTLVLGNIILRRYNAATDRNLSNIFSSLVHNRKGLGDWCNPTMQTGIRGAIHVCRQGQGLWDGCISQRGDYRIATLADATINSMHPYTHILVDSEVGLLSDA